MGKSSLTPSASRWAQADDAGAEFAAAVKEVVSGSCVAQRDALGVKLDLPIKCG